VVFQIQKGEFDLENIPRVGRPKETSGDVLQALLDEDDFQSMRKFSRLLNVDHTTILRILKAKVKVQIGTRCVPHKLTERQKCDRMNICMSFLGPHRNTGDEKCGCYVLDVASHLT